MSAEINGAPYGLNEVVYTATESLGDHREAHYQVRYTGRSGDGTLHFRLRRRLVDVRPNDGHVYAPRVGVLPTEWDCFVPIGNDGTAKARWSFGEDPELCRIDHYATGPANELVLLDSPNGESRKPRLGFRQDDDL